MTATDAAGNARPALSAPLTIVGAGFTPNAVTTYTYDPLNRPIQAGINNGVSITYRYDPAGNLIEVLVALP